MLTSDIIEKYGFGEYISSYASHIGENSMNISKDSSLDNLRTININEKKYEQHEHDFIKSKDTKLWEKVSKKTN